jgi:hypothetical protein
MHTPEWIILAVVVVGVIVALFGWDRYRGNKKSSGESSDSQATNEVFVDPNTGRRTRVWYNATTGEREYRAE